MKQLKRIATFFVLLIWPLTPFGCAQAETKIDPDSRTVQVNKDVCRYLTKHRPAPDVAYQPGVDVNGNAVAPADLSGVPPARLPEAITIDLSSKLSQWLPNANFPNNKLGDSDIEFGTIVLEGDKVTYNGQPLADPAQDELAVLCLQPN